MAKTPAEKSREYRERHAVERVSRDTDPVVTALLAEVARLTQIIQILVTRGSGTVASLSVTGSATDAQPVVVRVERGFGGEEREVSRLSLSTLSNSQDLGGSPRLEIQDFNVCARGSATVTEPVTEKPLPVAQPVTLLADGKKLTRPTQSPAAETQSPVVTRPSSPPGRATKEPEPKKPTVELNGKGNLMGELGADEVLRRRAEATADLGRWERGE